MANETPNPDPTGDLTARQAALEARETALTERENALTQRQGAAPTTGQPGPVQSDQNAYFEQMEDLMVQNPREFMRRFASDIRAATMAEVTPFMGTVAQGQVAESLGGKLGPVGQGYLREIVGKSGITNISALNAMQRDLMTRAAADYEREQIAANPKLAQPPGQMTPEPSFGLEPTAVTDADRAMYGPVIERIGDEAFLKMKKESAGVEDPLTR